MRAIPKSDINKTIFELSRNYFLDIIGTSARPMRFAPIGSPPVMTTSTVHTTENSIEHLNYASTTLPHLVTQHKHSKWHSGSI